MHLRVDLQMQLSHAGDDGLLTLRVEVDSKRGVLSGEAVDSLGELVRVVLRHRRSCVRLELTLHL